MFYVYKTTNLLNNMIYIGVHSYKSESHNIKYLVKFLEYIMWVIKM